MEHINEWKVIITGVGAAASAALGWLGWLGVAFVGCMALDHRYNGGQEQGGVVVLGGPARLLAQDWLGGGGNRRPDLRLAHRHDPGQYSRHHTALYL